MCERQKRQQARQKDDNSDRGVPTGRKGHEHSRLRGNTFRGAAAGITGQIHSLVQSSHLLGVTIKHLRANPIGVEQ